MLPIIVAAWLVAVCGWALHERSGTRFGRAFGNVSLIIALSTLTYTSLYGHRHDPPPEHVGGIQVVNLIQPQSDAAYVGSSLGETYHLPECFYVRQTKHLIHFLSREDAEDRGRKPCDNCIPYEDQRHVVAH